jgi:small GTP-binding protein
MSCQFRAVLLGDSSVGKTSLYERLQDRPFTQTISTLGAASASILINSAGGSTTNILLWDTAGQEAYRSILPIYFRDAAFVILVYDVTDARSFRSIDSWVSTARSKAPPAARFLLLANKADLETQREVSMATGANKAQDIDATFFETSAATGYGIKEVLQAIGELSIQHGNEFVQIGQSSLPESDDGCC